MNKKILIVDDEPDTLEMLCIAIDRGPFDVITAHNGESALKKVEEEKPDLIILDVMMPPGINGIEVCKVLKSKDETKNIPVILLTAVAAGVSLDHLFKPGEIENAAEEFLEKPADPNLLLERVNQLLGA